MSANLSQQDPIRAFVRSFFEPLESTDERVALAVYRCLARGTPAAPERIAQVSETSAEVVKHFLDTWIGVYRDDEENVLGFWGLAIPEMNHHFEVNGVSLFTWCAWDALFLPELLDETAHVTSACPISKQEVTLTVDAGGISNLQPATAVVSFLTPEREAFEDDVVSTFCHYVHFFASKDDGEKWTSEHPGTLLLTVDEAFQLGQFKNHHQFPSFGKQKGALT